MITLRYVFANFRVLALIIAGLLLPSQAVLSAPPTAVVNTTVTFLLNDSQYYGFCMARLGASLQALGLDCPPDPLVTFDCQGNYLSKTAGLTNFSAAQLAFVSGRRVNVIVEDQRKIHGHCLATRIDVF
jgi:hypothetical protein